MWLVTELSGRYKASLPTVSFKAGNTTNTCHAGKDTYAVVYRLAR